MCPSFRVSTALALFFFGFSHCVASEISKEHTDYAYQDHGPTTTLKSGLVGAIRIPTDALYDATIVALDGLVVSFSDGATFSTEIVTSENLGYPGEDLRTWPEYMFGLKENGDESESYIEEAAHVRKTVVERNIEPELLRIFPTAQGKGYWAYGESQSLIVLTSTAEKEQILLVYTHQMPETDIRKYIINGVIQNESIE